MEHNYQIEYENITLRPLAKGDIENLRIWRNDPKNTLFLRKIPFITRAMQLEWFNKYLQNNDEICFSIVETRQLKRMVGSLSLYQFADDSCFFGKILIGDVDAHGRKVGVNATIAVTKIAFEQMNIKQVKLHVFADNFVAVKVYKNAGFNIVEELNTESGKLEYLMIKDLRNKNE